METQTPTNDDTNIDTFINLITRQTELSYDEAKTRLENNNLNYIKVIEEYYGICKKKSEDTSLTVNQKIYKEIRSVMDDAAYRYYNKE